MGRSLRNGEEDLLLKTAPEWISTVLLNVHTVTFYLKKTLTASTCGFHVASLCLYSSTDPSAFQLFINWIFYLLVLYGFFFFFALIM